MKKVVSIILLFLMFFSLPACAKKEEKGLQLKGSYYENITDFTQESADTEVNAESITGVAKAYMQGVTYTVTDLDEEAQVATLEVSIPNFVDVLPSIVDEVLAENEGAEYEELLNMVQTRTEEALSSEDIACTSSTITLPIEEINGEYKLVYNEQWDQVVFGALQDLYLEYYRTMIGGLLDEIPE